MKKEHQFKIITSNKIKTNYTTNVKIRKYKCYSGDMVVLLAGNGSQPTADLTLSPHKAEKLASLSLQIPIRPKYWPAGLSLIPIKPKYRLANLEKKLLQITLCLGAPGRGPHAVGTHGCEG